MSSAASCTAGPPARVDRPQTRKGTRVVVDSGTRHRRSWRTWTCTGCGWPWPCNIILMHRANRREAALIAKAIITAVLVIALVLGFAATLSVY